MLKSSRTENRIWRIGRAVVVILILGLTILTWLALFHLARVGFKALEPITQPFDLAAVLLSASALYMAIISIIVTVGPIIGWPIIEKKLREWITVETEKRLEILEKETRGRSFATLGYILGESSVNSDHALPSDVVRLKEAVFHCQKAYDFLKGTGLPVEFGALNNLLEYYCILQDKPRRGYILEGARRLREAAQQHDARNPMLTYCRAVLTFSLEPEEIDEACLLVEDLKADSRLTDKERREVELLVTLCARYKATRIAAGYQRAEPVAGQAPAERRGAKGASSRARSGKPE